MVSENQTDTLPEIATEVVLQYAARAFRRRSANGVKALNHYYASTSRDDGRYKELAERIQRKGPERQESIERPTKKKRA